MRHKLGAIKGALNKVSFGKLIPEIKECTIQVTVQVLICLNTKQEVSVCQKLR